MRLQSLAALSLLVLTGCVTQPATLALTPARWRADLNVFATELPARHINAFHFTSRDAFEHAVSDLDGRLDNLDGDQSFVGFEQLARMIGDGHTGFQAPPEFASQLPIKLQRFGDDYRITDVAPGAESLLGARLVAIDGVPVDEVHRRLLTVTPADEGIGVREGLADRRMALGLFLHGLGVTPRRDQARVTATSDDERTLTVDLTALPAGVTPQWTSAATATPLMRQHPDDALWCDDAAPGVLYCDFRRYDGLAAPAAALRQRLAKNPPGKLIIDLRSNGGGDYNVGLRQLVDPIRNDASVNRKGRLFVLIGPMTFSAAMSNSAHFRQRTAATLVGEPIGERPNSYQENRELVLPNSHLVLSYSTRLYQFAPADPTNEIRPDVPIVTSWDDYKAGRDPVVAWVIAQPDDP
jgi:hypothetical protein